MPENEIKDLSDVKGAFNGRSAVDIAFLLLHGKQLALNEELGWGYLAAFIQNIERNMNVADLQRQEIKKSQIEILSPSCKVVVTGDLWDWKNDQVSDLPKDSIIKVKLNDYMAVDDQFCGPMGVRRLADNLLFYKDHKNVRGAILETNTGGGEALAGQIMYNAVVDFGKPVISYVHTAASAGYMAVLPTTEIIASGYLSRVGSIGAYTTVDNAFIDYYKKRYTDIYAKQSDDKNYPIRAYMSGDSEPLRESISQVVDIFHAMVEKHRTSLKKKDTTLKGGLFNAQDGKDRGLINLIGGEDVLMKRINIYTK